MENGALVSLYEPQNISLGSMASFRIPDGDGYTTVALNYAFNRSGLANGDNGWNLSIDGTYTGFINESTAPVVDVTIGGGWIFQFAGAGVANYTTVKLENSAGTAISGPSVLVIEGKDYNSVYEAIITDVDTSAGTSTDPVGVNDVYFTSPSLWNSVSLQSDSDITESVDWYGSLVTEDSNTASQKIVTISVPGEQAYANIYVSEGSVSLVSEVGTLVATDAETAKITGKNLIVVGGSCINSVAASLLGGAACGEAFTAKTGVSAGQFLLQSFAREGKVALLVAGYDATDTTKAATYLVNNATSLNTAVGTKEVKSSTVVASLA
jgi:hypothetical protein